MTEQNRYTVLPKVSIRPTSFTFYNQFYKNFGVDHGEKIAINPEAKKALQDMGALPTKLVDSNKHNLELSHKAAKRIREKVNWIFALSKKRDIVTHDGKSIFGFKMNFITLTLPAQQAHSTDVIIKSCLNQTLTELKAKFGLQNYVWRLEYQKNGNAHFHIATDCFMEYWAVRSIWNRCLNKLGYVDRYMNANLGLTFEEYCAKVNRFNTYDTQSLERMYKFGVETKWSKPNSVDIRVVKNGANIAFYIAKYITKKDKTTVSEKEQLQKDELIALLKEREGSNSNMRLWFCSRSLSKLDKISLFMEEVNELAESCYKEVVSNYVAFHDYCKVVYFNLGKQSNIFKRQFRDLIYNYASLTGYFGLKIT